MELAAGSGMAGKKMRFICNTLHGWKVDTGVDVMLSSFAQLGPLLWLSREYTQQRSCMRSFADNPYPPPPPILQRQHWGHLLHVSRLTEGMAVQERTFHGQAMQSWRAHMLALKTAQL